MESVFKALLVKKDESGHFKKGIEEIPFSDLPMNDLLIKVKYSSVNYKDALSASGNKGVTRDYPHVPGIDASGVVMGSNVPDFKNGDEVLVTGFDLGMNTWGGFGEYISIPAHWAIPLPQGISLKESMQLGTAGLTAGLSVLKIVQAGITPSETPVVVSGGTGGVGSLAIAILARLGYKVLAISGKKEESYLKETLGASEVISRDEFISTYNARTLNKEIFAAGIDTVGGEILSGMLKGTIYGGIVTCCGMIASSELTTSIFPFILRGVGLMGIDSVQASLEVRKEVWHLLSSNWKPSNLQDIAQEIFLEALPHKLEEILQGKAKGRYVLTYE